MHPGCTWQPGNLTDIQARAQCAWEHITESLKAYALSHPALDENTYQERFTAELMQVALDVFLPAVLYYGYKHAGNCLGWIEYNGSYYYIPKPDPDHMKKKGRTSPGRYSLAEYRRLVSQSLRFDLQYYHSRVQSSVRFFKYLHLAQLGLSLRPLLTMDSGEYESDKRTQTHYITHPAKTITHPQRSYQDMLNEVASQLTNLALYTAQVRISTEAGLVEHTIRTLDPKQQPDKPLFGQPLQERLTRIRGQNITDGYLREQATVEEEIRIRQAQCSEPLKEQPGAIYRRQPP